MPPRSPYDVLTSFGTARAVTPRFRPGQKVKLPAELGGKVGEIVAHHGAPYALAWLVKVDGVHLIIDEPHLTKAAPQWRPGDVVIVRWHGATSTPYTYVRGMYSWPGERSPKTDAQIDELYLAGKAKPVLQSGGEPFDEGRL
ncbi:hypothetical protein [Micromonospora sp. NPDC047730]|uniref:hypothetical protein n=1 Tax=Micromonospora sp. NPDC047730 TaxID=3364253 RepID=UPI00371F183C